MSSHNHSTAATATPAATAAPFLLDQASLKCKAECGFFGNPEWSGYCSVCYKRLNEQSLQAHIDQQEQERKLAQTASQRHQVAQVVNKFGLSSIVMSSYDTLTNLHNTILNTAKSPFVKQPQSMQRPTPQAQQQSTTAPPSPLSPEPSRPANSSSSSSLASRFSAVKSPRSLLNFDGLSIKDLHSSSGSQGSTTPTNSSKNQQLQFSHDVAWQHCLNSVNKFASEFLKAEQKPSTSLNDLSAMVHSFFLNCKKQFDTGPMFQRATQAEIELLADNMERVLNEQIYAIISARIVNEDEEINMAIQKKIRSLYWITLKHLDIAIDLELPVVRNLMDKAICQLIEINPQTSSIDKLECITECSKTLSELLKNADIGLVSADQFLPLLVYVLLQANPPMLPADVKYLNCFSNPARLLQGETGYYFTNLCIALKFIENANGPALNISQEEFDQYMQDESFGNDKTTTTAVAATATDSVLVNTDDDDNNDCDGDTIVGWSGDVAQ